MRNSHLSQASIVQELKDDLAKRLAGVDALNDVERWMVIVAKAWDVLDEHRMAAENTLPYLVQEYAR